ncbi:hypothetical protein [Glaciecola sp. MF2-115]|uniref:hypothetical protein n=1 Tax=Glaciecola sp. MF2-115 TaxID=3384827 RepID=UPI0039A004B8
MKTLIKLYLKMTFITLFIFGTSTIVSANELFTLKNLERERANLISDFLNINIDSQKKHQRLLQRQRQLADMERMVLRDERLLMTQSSMVKNAFKEYDKTFLVHAGAENNVNAMTQWLTVVNVTNDSVLNAKAGYR